MHACTDGPHGKYSEGLLIPMGDVLEAALSFVGWSSCHACIAGVCIQARASSWISWHKMCSCAHGSMVEQTPDTLCAWAEAKLISNKHVVVGGVLQYVRARGRNQSTLPPER